MFNLWKTALLMTAITILFISVGWMLCGSIGIAISLIFSFLTNFFLYWYSDKIVLHMYNAREVDENTTPQLYQIVKELAKFSKLPIPRLYIIEEDAPNAFATGRSPNHAAIATTTGILKILSGRELRGVIAHELAHIKHRDILISTITATVAGSISILTNLLIFPFDKKEEDNRYSNPIAIMIIKLLAPIAGVLIQMAISRVREFEADRSGAKISGDPRSLALALEKIHHYAINIPFIRLRNIPTTAQMMIINPLNKNNFQDLFSTHPSVNERISRLMNMAKNRSLNNL